MRLLLKLLCLSVAVFCVSANADSAQIAPFSTFHEEMRYWGNDSICNKALHDVYFHEKFTSDFVPGPYASQGMIYVTVKNPASGTPPINTYLFKNGDADRYGFTNYYSPDVLLKANHQTLGLHGIIFNLCLDGQKQSGLIVDVPDGERGGHHCLVTTHAWNYCR